MAIHIKSPALTFRAGPGALAHIRKNGLSPQDVGIIPGAAGGPKALGIQGLDLALFGDWLKRSPRERALIGASIGSWRFACACSPDPARSIRRLGELYTQQCFPRSAGRDEISASCAQMLDELLGGHDHDIVNTPYYRLNILIVKSRGLMRHEDKLKLILGTAAVIADNVLSRQRLARHFERILIHDGRAVPPMSDLTDFPSHIHSLSVENLRPALLASGSIPLVMNAIHAIPGLPDAVYRDGGLLDYHLDLPYRGNDIVLYPHFIGQIIPGWFDKGIPWRRGCPERLSNVLLIAPSPEYLSKLPYGKLPDRKDFSRYLNDDRERQRYWRKAMDESIRLGDEFLELADTETLIERLQPL